MYCSVTPWTSCQSITGIMYNLIYLLDLHVALVGYLTSVSNTGIEVIPQSW